MKLERNTENTKKTQKNAKFGVSSVIVKESE